jgi:hypothetical protein
MSWKNQLMIERGRGEDVCGLSVVITRKRGAGIVGEWTIFRIVPMMKVDEAGSSLACWIISAAP